MNAGSPFRSRVDEGDRVVTFRDLAISRDAARRLETGGAEGLVLATSTMHHVATAIEAAVAIPLLHIVDSTGAALHEAGIQRAGLLGTRYTMELPFWRDRLAERFGVQLVVPDADDRAVVHRVIYEQLCLGRIEAASRTAYADIIRRLANQGAEAAILGCTEITLLISADDSPLAVFDTTALHAATAVDFILGTCGGQGEATPAAKTRRRWVIALNESTILPG